ncbi:aminotransferase [Malaciobacter halophilus]|uniref:cysteine-S-conjugate beta-lyase n=1 Tax=Malaciobacter halophilus TaxID=197482 RepID=A0A2N1J314_9BACT|nr:PatB family C-S lyase [Malaciobacter halophilus]AXH10607.1 putative C-S lyase [Malaciobacter halophilus]PKI80949.1 aminotransferase [Malaciobacter halophilus]
MNNYNFDEYINRKNSDCVKYDGLKKYFNVDDARPMWVADMDFKTPQFILEDLKKVFDKKILGYPIVSHRVYNSIISWYKNRHQISNFDKNDILLTTGVVTALSACIEAFCNIEDEVIIQTPVYFPFFSVVKDNNRKLIINPLKNKKDYYTMDFEDLKSKITSKTKLLILCSPHNPVGRVWSKEELLELAKICYEHNITIISDEIHSDLVFKKFTSFLHLEDKYLENVVILNSPSKTFNLAGLNSSYIICKNDTLKTRLNKVIQKRHIASVNIFGLESIISSYTKGEEWLKMLLFYLQDNIITVEESLKQNGNNITFCKPEATYLLWLNFSKINDSHKNIFSRLLHNAGLALNDGSTFGKEAKHYFRLNIALSKDELIKSLSYLNNEFN